MADLLTHVLIPFILLTIVGWRVDFKRYWIPVAMGGAAIPDLVKVRILLSSDTIEKSIDSGFSYSPISTIAGVIAISAIIAILFDREYRRCAFVFLTFGGLTALILDGLRVFADGHSNFWLYPLWFRPPSPNLYVSSDIRVLGITIVLSTLVYVLNRYGFELRSGIFRKE